LSQPIAFDWAELTAKAASYLRVPKRRIPPPNAALRLRKAGYRTVGELCEAAGVPPSTFDTWEGKRLPKLPRINGVRVVPSADFERWVADLKVIANKGRSG
jgi:hypothetical protein